MKNMNRKQWLIYQAKIYKKARSQGIHFDRQDFWISEGERVANGGKILKESTTTHQPLINAPKATFLKMAFGKLETDQI